MNALGKILCALAMAAAALATTEPAHAREGTAVKCGDKNDSGKDYETLEKRTDGKDLWVLGNCRVPAGDYIYGDVNIYGKGALTFQDEVIDFWAKNIVVENGGSLLAGVAAPIGTAGGRLTIHLYGAEQGVNPGGVGVDCIQKYCGIPDNIWNNTDPDKKWPMPGAPDDYFYPYGPLMYDGGKLPADTRQGTDYGFFGYKVIAVSYGGTLKLLGRKGATYGDLDVSSPGKSWARLVGTVSKGRKIVVDTDVVDTSPQNAGVSWKKGDKIVLTTTDYLPGHSEELTIQSIEADGRTINVEEEIKYRHQGEKYLLPSDVGRLKLDFSSVETRAAVALLSRSITIVSEGSTATPDGFAQKAGTYFGGHTVARQGFKAFQVQGVEFKQLGQGGRIGHYPVHFHMARTTPANTFVKDSSVNESMTRWMVVHSTHGITFARNVGWKSIGHGFYIEDGSETDNRYQTNIGIYARAAIDDPTVNPRRVPGILAASRNGDTTDNVPFYTDVDHPSVFWIMNGWNDFEYNFAVGAGMCGACYWLVPGANSGHSRHMKFEGYASLQANADLAKPLDRAAMTPLRKFTGNSCSSAMNSFNTIGNTTACFGAGFEAPLVPSVQNPFDLPAPCDQTNGKVDGQYKPNACILHEEADDYYPKVDQGGGRFATTCSGGDCSKVDRCSSDSLDTCEVTVIDRYTSSFHWTETNFAAIWLRPQWYLFTNSALTDVQNGGITFVTGGGYTESDVIKGHWALARKSVFIGTAQDPNAADASGYASPLGPFNAKGLPINCNGNHCLSAKDGVSFPITNHAMNQRMFSIYDGPAYQESNAYLDIRKVPVPGCGLAPPNQPAYVCGGSTLIGHVLGLPWDKQAQKCNMPNAAIAWKQPNGFFYPPAFHSANLYFKDVDIRHFVIEPLFKEGTYKTADKGKLEVAYCNWNDALFEGFTDIDRQTELSDDDGSLTGYAQTVSVNLDPFFNAPVEAIECASEETAKTSPYDYVTSVVYPACATDDSCSPKCPPNTPCPPFWDSTCSNQNCYGVPLYRQFTVKDEKSPGVIKMAGQDTYQRSTLTTNNGKYFIDTSVSEAKQRQTAGNVNVFKEGLTYYLFELFAKSSTVQTYEIYVGDSFNPDTDVWATRADTTAKKIKFPMTAWPSTWDRPSYANGILTVTMRMNFDEFTKNYAAAFEGRCQPRSFCSWTPDPSNLKTGGTCGCNPSSPFAALCQDTNNAGENVCAWAQKDIDCPKGGCYGIGFRMGKMTYDAPMSPRPAPVCYPKAGFDVKWLDGGDIAQSCKNAPTIPPQFCN